MNIISLLLSVITLASCNSIRVSSYARYNRLENGYMKICMNDSLKFEMEFYGLHSYEPIENNKEIKLPFLTKTMLKRIGLWRKGKALFYYKGIWNDKINDCTGFIIDSPWLLNPSLFYINKKKDVIDYAVLKNIYKRKDRLGYVYARPLKGKIFVFISTQISNPPDFSSGADSAFLHNAKDEFFSMVSDKNYFQYTKRKQELSSIITNAIWDSVNYIKPINQLLNITEDTIFRYQLQPYYYDPLLTRLSFLDNLDKLKENYESYRNYLSKNTIDTSSRKSNAIIGGDALSKVYDLAKNQQMIMINESHYDYRNRLFTYLLLDSLYNLGYRHLCLEDRVYDTKESKILPSKDDGFYIQEPFMAMLVRKAIRLGISIHAYEDTTSEVGNYSSQIEKREYNEGLNLSNLFKTDTAHKWIVHAGWDHINKKSSMENSLSAAGYFKKISGIDPLSINQSYYSDINNSKQPSFPINTGYYFLDTTSDVYKEGQADLYIANNIERHPFEFPFQYMIPHFKQYRLSLKTEELPKDCSLFIYVKAEYEKLEEKAVPIYIKQFDSSFSPILYLPIDEYVGIVKDKRELQYAICSITASG